MSTQISKRSPLGVLAIAALSSVAMTFGGSAAAQAPPSARSPHVVQAAGIGLTDLEEAFWVCDYVATTQRIADDRIGVCAAAYDELKQRKFGGDVDDLLRWWRENKPTQHARLSALVRPRQ